jgi:ectoine hydroxylase-related dioxygenase (phytanoyl-CoA dioxygenase family)
VFAMPIAPDHVVTCLNAHYALSQDQIALFRAQGFIRLKEVFSPNVIEYINGTISDEVKRLNTQHLPMEERDTYGRAFLQIMNIWTQSEAVKEIVFSKRLARLATELLEVEGVRLYHDQALYKEPGGGQTPWHADQYYWPLASDRTVTAWIPLQATPLQMGPLAFSAGSQNLSTGRNLKISDESQQVLEQTLQNHGFTQVEESFDAGDVSFHLGWLYHRAGANNTNHMRRVMTAIYMEKDMRLKAPENDNQVADWEAWCPGAIVGEVIDTPLNPVL